MDLHLGPPKHKHHPNPARLHDSNKLVRVATRPRPNPRRNRIQDLQQHRPTHFGAHVSGRCYAIGANAARAAEQQGPGTWPEGRDYTEHSAFGRWAGRGIGREDEVEGEFRGWSWIRGNRKEGRGDGGGGRAGDTMRKVGNRGRSWRMGGGEDLFVYELSFYIRLYLCPLPALCSLCFMLRAGWGVFRIEMLFSLTVFYGPPSHT